MSILPEVQLQHKETSSTSCATVVRRMRIYGSSAGVAVQWTSAVSPCCIASALVQLSNVGEYGRMPPRWKIISNESSMSPNLTRGSVEKVTFERGILRHVSPFRCCGITVVPCWCPIRIASWLKVFHQRISIVVVLNWNLVWYFRCSRRKYYCPASSDQSEMSDRRKNTLRCCLDGKQEKRNKRHNCPMDTASTKVI